jgi:hypothetical protein
MRKPYLRMVRKFHLSDFAGKITPTMEELVYPRYCSRFLLEIK